MTFACRRASFQTARDPFEVNEEEAQAQDEDDVERDSWRTVVKPAPARLRWRCLSLPC